jgi:hypothetical protein
MKAKLLPHAEVYDQCLLEWARQPRFFQEKGYHTSAPPMVICPWNGRSPFDLDNVGIASYVPRCKTVRAYGR